MNQLSWMIYLADVAGNFVLVLSALGLIGTLGGGIIWAMSCDPYLSMDGARPKARKACVGGVAVLFFVAIVPSKSTIYAIAASELGEDVLKSETGSKALKALDAWLDRQIEGETDEQ